MRLPVRNLDHISFEKVYVTPELAQGYLDDMHDNRTPSRMSAATMSELLRENNFFGGISPVYFDAEGLPWDGQHRFEAIVDTGIAAWLVFITGVTPEEAQYIDTGRARTHADSLKIRNMSHYKRRAELSRMLGLYAKYDVEGVRNPNGLVLTLSEKEIWVDAPGVTEAIQAGEQLRRAGISPTLGAYAVFQTMQGTTPAGIDADGFWESVRTGAGLEEGDPALTLRNFTMANRKTGRLPADPRLMGLYILATAWNKHVLGEKWAKPSPRYETRATNGQKFFPASQVPDFLPLDTRQRLRQLQEAHVRLQAARNGSGA